MLAFGFRNLLSRPLRSSLSLLGLSVAIIGMIGLFSVAAGIDRTVSNTFDRVPGVVVMQPGAPIPIFSRLPADWTEELRALPDVHVVCPELWARAHIIEGKAISAPPRFLFGIDIPARLQLRRCVYREVLAEGRFLTAQDEGRPNCLISRQIAEEFHKSVGDRLRIDGRSLTIVGIYNARSLLLDAAIVLDRRVVEQIARMEHEIVSCYYVEQETGVPAPEMARRIQDLLRGRSGDVWQAPVLSQNPLQAFFNVVDYAIKQYGRTPRRIVAPAEEPRSDEPLADESPDALPPPEETTVEVRTADDWGAEFKRLSHEIDVFLYLLTGIGVTIAVMSIVNTMLMSVTERIVEFGVLKANGWSDGDVLRLVASESAVLGVAGGLIGALAGWGATVAVNTIWGDRLLLYASWPLLGFSVVFSAVLGLAGGLYPALWAARLPPMEAIRRA